MFKIINARPGKSITVDIQKPFNKSTTVDDNDVNVIDFFDQLIKINITIQFSLLRILLSTSWENLFKHQDNLSLVIIFLILVTCTCYNEVIGLGEI